jgi:hypothetical protein
MIKSLRNVFISEDILPGHALKWFDCVNGQQKINLYFS